MSFYDDASLVFLPSGGAGKDTKAYSIKPTDGSGDFTFSRGNNLSATRVDSNGLIEKGRENLLLQSNQFDTTWTTSNSSVTSGQSGYDGSSDAWLLENTSTSFPRIEQAKSISGVVTCSIYAKAGTNNFVRPLQIGGSNAQAYFDLSNGTIANESNVIDAKIESVGSGWYRCSITFDGATTAVRIYSADAVGSFALGNTIIQSAQLEIGLVATEYIESGATTGKAGLLEDSPRFDYSGGASCPSLLLEPSRTNFFNFSEYFDGWNLFTNMTPTANNATSPEGLQNAYKMETTAGAAYFRDAQTLSAGNNVFSIFAKRGNSQYIFLRTRFFTGGDNADVWFDVQNGTKGGNLGDSVTYDIEDYGNGWYRCYMVHNVDVGDLFGYAYVGLTNTDEDTTGESGLNGYFYGGQWEEGSYPTSYIPNHSGGSVTRNADECTKTSISGLIGQTEGTIYCEFEYNGAADSGVFNRIIGLGTGVTQNRILLAKNDTTAELVAFAVTGGTTQVFQAIAGTSIIGHHKVAISYKANEYKVYLDGQLKFTDTSASVPATTDVYIGTAEDGTTNNELGGVVKQSIIYKEVLSEDNCKALTTL